MVEKSFSPAEKLIVVKILRALNKFYSLRDLEKILDVPFQSLWKYINLIGMPSEEVAEAILSKISKFRIVDEILTAKAKEFRVAPYNLSTDIGFLELYAIKIGNSIRDRDIDLIMALSQEAIPLATILGIELNTNLCTPIPNENLVSENFKILTYYSQTFKEVKMLIYPKQCIKEGRKVFLVDFALLDIDKLEAVNAAIKSRDGEIDGVATVYISKCVLVRLIQFNIKNVYYVDIL